VASLSQGRTAAAQCGLFTHKSVPVIFEPPCMLRLTDTYWFFIHYHNAISDSKFSQFYTKRLSIQTAIFDDRRHKIRPFLSQWIPS